MILIAGSAQQINGNLLKIIESLLEGFFVRITGGHPNPNAADRHLNPGANFQSLQPSRRALCPLQFRVFQRNAPQVLNPGVRSQFERFLWTTPP